jgi:hypothetical protein
VVQSRSKPAGKSPVARPRHPVWLVHTSEGKLEPTRLARANKPG